MNGKYVDRTEADRGGKGEGKIRRRKKLRWTGEIEKEGKIRKK